jgi:hypothetical protein
LLWGGRFVVGDEAEEEGDLVEIMVDAGETVVCFCETLRGRKGGCTVPYVAVCD